MNELDRAMLMMYVQGQIAGFHKTRLAALNSINLKDILKRKNPYLFRAKNLTTAAELTDAMLDALLSSSEEKIFGDFLEDLAIFVSRQTCGGRKSSATGIDLEFENENHLFLVSIKSGPNWANNTQTRKLTEDFQKALRTVRQAPNAMPVSAVLGICYGKSRRVDNGIFLKIMGQQFWHFISGDNSLYIDIVEPIGHEAQAHNEQFKSDKAALQNRLLKGFIDEFCFSDGKINWEKLVRFNSGNM